MPGKVNKCNIPQYTFNLYKSISSKLLDLTSKVGNTGESTGAEARKTVPHGVQKAKRERATESTGAEARKTGSSSRPLSPDVLQHAQLSTDTHRSLGNKHEDHAESPGPRLGTHTATQRLPDCLLYTSPSPRDDGVSRMPSSA